jgi:hypothetical protein
MTRPSKLDTYNDGSVTNLVALHALSSSKHDMWIKGCKNLTLVQLSFFNIFNRWQVVI